MSTSVFRRVSISRTYPSRLFLLLGNKLKFCHAIVIPTSHTQKDPCPVYYRLCNTSLWRQCISVLIWRRCSKVRCQLYNLHNRLCDTSLWRQSISVLIWRRCSEVRCQPPFPTLSSSISLRRVPPLFAFLFFIPLFKWELHNTYLVILISIFIMAEEMHDIFKIWLHYFDS